MADLTTIANAKEWLQIKSTGDDALLTRLITAMSSAVERYLGRSLLTGPYTEIRDGTGGQRLSFANYPVTVVTSVIVDGQSIPAAATAIGSGYTFSPTAIVLRGYSFTRDLQNVALSYTAGYATLPPDVEQAVIDWLSLLYRARDRIGHQSKSIAGETVSFFIGDMPKSVKTMLNPYRKVAPC